MTSMDMPRRASEERSIPSSYRPKSASGLLATDYAISDYTTWK